jgi:phosphatidylglycerophosphatase A
MRVTEKIKHFCFVVSTFGLLGEWWIGGIFVSMLSIPLLFLLQSIYWLNQIIFYWTLAFGAIFFLVFMQWALQYDKERARNAIVCDKIIGAMIALAGVPLKWRVVIFGFILFHFMNTMRPFAWYRKILNFLEKLPGVFGILLGDVLSGLLVNLFLQLTAWIMG